MNWVFSDALLVEALQIELERWRGTPFFPRTAMPGIGADCVRFALGVHQSLGVIGPAVWPRYPIKGGSELLSIIDGRLLAETCLRCVFRRAESRFGDFVPMPGDVWLADRPVHLAISGIDGLIWHCLYPEGVHASIISAALHERVVAVYRAEVAV
jgi:hypothetical protein